MSFEPGGRRHTALLMVSAEVLLWTLAWGTPLALGGAPAWVLWPVVALSMAALGCVAAASALRHQALPVPLLAWPAAVVAVLCALQLVPLPAFALERLSPVGAELRAFALVPLGLDGPRPISLDPPATWRALALSLSLFAVVVAAAEVARSRRARRRMLGAIALCGAVIAVIGLGHRLLDVHALFGLYAFKQAQPPLLTPFGNPNHLASFLILSSALAMGRVLRSDSPVEAALWALVFLLGGAAVALSLSRGGIFFFVVGQALLAGALMVTRPEPKERPTPRRRYRTRPARPGESVTRPAEVASRWRLGLLTLLGLVVVFGVAGYLALDRLLVEAGTIDSVAKVRASKVDLWPSFARAAAPFWPAGMGRGAFEAGFTRFQEKFPGNTFAQPENAVLQLVTELGVVGGLGVLALMVLGFVRALRRPERTPLDLAAAAGLAALGLHDLFDFALELPACAVAAAVVLGCLARAEHRRRPHASRAVEGGEPAVAVVAPEERSARAPSVEPHRSLRSRWDRARVSRRALVPVAVVLPVVALGAAALGRSTLASTAVEVNRLLRADLSPLELKAAVLPLIDRHPADYLLYGAVGHAYAGKGGDPQTALAFVNRALFLRPLDAESHRTAARSLLRLGRRAQGLNEYRLATEDPEGHRYLEEGVRLARGVDELRRVIPPEPERVRDVAQKLWLAGRQDEAVGLAEWGTQAFPATEEVAGVWSALAAFRNSRGQNAEALEALDQADRLNPSNVQALILRARVLAALGRRAEAIALLDRRVVQQPGSVELSFALVEQYLEAHQSREALTALARVNPFIGPGGPRGQLFVLTAQAFEQLGRITKALSGYQSAVRLDPERPYLRYQVARLYEAMGRPGDALQALREGMRRDSPEGLKVATPWAERLVKLSQEQDERRRERSLSEERALEIDRLLDPASPDG